MSLAPWHLGLVSSAQTKTFLPCLLSYATGTLLGAAFLGMIPKGVQQATAWSVSSTVLAGIVLFFFLEKMVIWRHCHETECEVHGSAEPLILIGDAFHNFVHGFVIAAAFLTSIPLGIAASLAVIAHEVPQEVGDFAILLGVHTGDQLENTNRRRRCTRCISRVSTGNGQTESRLAA